MKFTVWNYQHGNTYIEVQNIYSTIVLVVSLVWMATHLIVNLNDLHLIVLFKCFSENISSIYNYIKKKSVGWKIKDFVKE